MKEKPKQVESTSTVAPVKYRNGIVRISAAALRKVPDASAPIEGSVHRGDMVSIVGEKDGFYQLSDGLWILAVAVKTQE